ncbi:MAG: polyhydroxyalkanoate depolymerase [Betaproteobacteria bacterium]|nr:polyhydroxyalkanoate depolymerase [Betaproteobacteria bacterium]
MLYKLYETQHQILGPWRYAAEAARSWFDHPFSPLAYTPIARRVAASNDLFLRITQRYQKPPWNIDCTTVAGEEVAVEIVTELDKPFCKLIHFRRAIESPQGRNRKSKAPRVLLVAPLSGHHATLLRDTVRSLLPEHDVWVTDWVDARMVPLSAGPFQLADYVDYVREFITLLTDPQQPNLNVISVCQPTVPVLCAVALMAQDAEPAARHLAPKTMVMMGGPIDARKSPTAVNNLATQKSYAWFEQNVIQRVPEKYPGYSRRVYPGFLQHLGFVAMNPDRHLNAHWDYFNHLLAGDDGSAEKHREFYDEYNAVLDLPAEYYLDTIKLVFQDFALPKGQLYIREQLVRPQVIRDTALLTIEGELDDISGNGQTEAAHLLCFNIPAARREHYVAPGTGHYGIFAGRRWRETICPKIRDFIRTHA